MSLLYNSRCNIIRETTSIDAYGGAVVTGTILHANEPCRLDYYSPKISPNAIQGMETEKVYSVFFRSTRQHPILIRENDIVVITFPPVHSDLAERFRVRGVQEESLHRQDPNKIVECTMTRIFESRGDNY